MKNFRLLPLLCGLVVACGERQPPPRPGEVLFWKVTSSDISFSQCTDDPTFRGPLQPIEISENSYIVLRVSEDGKTAAALDCQTKNVSTCVPSATGIVFDIAGNELLFSQDSKTAITNSNCTLTSAQAWRLEDKGTTLELDISNALSLTDAPSECESFENALKAQSPNGLGITGCVVTFQVTAQLD